jgi:hypothetical protein
LINWKIGIRNGICESGVQYQRQIESCFSSVHKDGLVAPRETYYHDLGWSLTFQQAPRNELFSTFRSSGMHHYAVRSGRYSRQSCAEVRSTSSSLLTVKSKRRSVISRQITIHRAPLLLRYTSRSARMVNSLVLPGVSFAAVVFFAHRFYLKV